MAARTGVKGRWPAPRLAAHLPARRVLVTGAGGPLGRTLLRALLAGGHRPRVLTHTRRDWPAGVEPWAADLAAVSSLAGLCDGIDLVFHLASHHPPPDHPRPEQAPHHRQVTEQGTRRLLEEAVRAGVGRLVFSSSTRVLEPGDGEYARAKRAAEALLAHAPLTTCSLRLPPLYGIPGRGLVAQLAAGVRSGRLPGLPELGERRSLLHVEDAARALLLAAMQKLEGAWTVTDGRSHSVHGLQQQLSRCLDRPPPRPWPRWSWQLAALAGEALERLIRRPMPLNRSLWHRLNRDAWFDGRPFAQATGFEPIFDLCDWSTESTTHGLFQH